MSQLAFLDAVNAAVADEMEADHSVFMMGTNPPAPLRARFPERVRATPIAESAITGMALGAAGCGLRPIVIWGCASFSFVAFDQVVNQIARLRYMSGGQRSFPLVCYTTYTVGERSAAQHAHTAYAMYAHSGGLKIVAPSCAPDAYDLMRAAIRDDNPVVFLHALKLSPIQGDVSLGATPPDDHALRSGNAAVRRRGTDVTIVAIGRMVGTALAAADRLASVGVVAEVVDPRTLVPLDIKSIRQSVERTGALLVVDESNPTCSMAAEIIVSVLEGEGVLSRLSATPTRVCNLPVPLPFSPTLEDAVLPSVDRVYERTLDMLGRK